MADGDSRCLTRSRRGPTTLASQGPARAPVQLRWTPPSVGPRSLPLPRPSPDRPFGVACLFLPSKNRRPGLRHRRLEHAREESTRGSRGQGAGCDRADRGTGSYRDDGLRDAGGHSRGQHPGGDRRRARILGITGDPDTRERSNGRSAPSTLIASLTRGLRDAARLHQRVGLLLALAFLL